MEYVFVKDVPEEEHDAFIAVHPYGNLLQSSKWGLVKSNWKRSIVGVKKDDQLVAGGMILIKELPLRFTIFYIPRGPVMDYANEELVTFMMSSLKQYAKKHHCLFIIFDPALECAIYTMEENAVREVQPQAEQMISLLQTLGVHFHGFTQGMEQTIQPRCHAVVHACDGFEESLCRHCRKAVSTTKKKMVQMEVCHEDGIDELSYVLHCTEERKNIHLRDRDYLRRLMNLYGEDAVIILARLPLKQLYDRTITQYDKNTEELRDCPPNARKKRFTLTEQRISLSRELRELKQHMKHDGESVIISGALCIKFGTMAEILYAGMNDRYKHYMAPYASFYECMDWSWKKGCKWCNMGGIEGDLQGGLAKFKAGFHPLVHEYVGEFDLPVNAYLYKIARYALNWRKRKNGKKEKRKE